VAPTTASSAGDDVRATSSRRVRHWPFWSLNGWAKAFLVGVEVLAVVLTVVAVMAVVTSGMKAEELGRFALLSVLAIGYAEAADRVERLKRFLGSDRVWSNQTTIWVFAAALVLPAGYAAAVVALVYTHVFVLGRRHQAVRPHRLLFSAATMTLAALAAAALADNASGWLTMGDGPAAALTTAAAMALFPLVNLGVLVVGMAIATRPEKLTAILPARDVVGFEFVTIVLGVVTAQFVVHTVWLTPVILVLVAALHRSSLVKELQIAAATDLKTGLLNAGTWRERATQQLSYVSRVSAPVAVLLIDLDHFKTVNDTQGHLAGDELLVKVAGAVRRQNRSHDVLGRFGGEEFIVFLQGVTLSEAVAVAERLRTRIARVTTMHGVGVTASIGVAHAASGRGVSLAELIGSADRALYEAKAAGRDRVRSTIALPTVPAGRNAMTPGR